jgi:uncharacterized protein (DUF934 family)
MATIIKDKKLAADPWLRLEAGTDGAAPAIPAEGAVIVPLSVWRVEREALLARTSRVGIQVDGHEEPSSFADDLRHFGVVAVYFKSFADGRGFSLGRLLRERYDYRGELRAVGDIFRDQLHFLAGCGFDAFELREGESALEALAGFRVFSEAYQASTERPLPLFRRRHAAPIEGAGRPKHA